MVHTPLTVEAVPAVMNLTAGALVTVTGAGVLLYERFSSASVRFALLTALVGGVLFCYALHAMTGMPLWYRGALALDSLVAAAVYTLAVHLVQARRHYIVGAVWVTGGVLAGWSIASAAVAGGIAEFGGTERFLHGGAWAGTVLIVYMTALIAGTLGELMWASQRSVEKNERKGARVLMLGLSIGSLGMIDFFIPRTLWGGGVTPVATAVAAIVLGYAAIRFRIFSPFPVFATDRILQVMSDGVLLCDVEGRIRNANRAACTLLGASEAELRGLYLESMIRVPDAAAACAESADGSRCSGDSDGEVLDRELILSRPGGGDVEVSLSSEPLRRRGTPIGNVVVFRDIGERNRAARELLTTEQRYNLLFWSNPALAYEISLDGRIVHANPAVQHILGHSAEELRSRSFTEFIHPDDLDASVVTYSQVLAGRSEEFRIRILPPSGETLQVKGVTIPITRDGVVTGIFGMAIDITEEERIRDELDVQRREFAEFFESSPEAVLIADSRNIIRRVNPEFCRIFGYEADQVVGRSIQETIVPPGRVEESLQLSGAARCGEIIRTETIRQRADGSLFPVSLLARQFALPGRPAQLYGIYRDMTEQREAESALREREEQLRHAQRLESVGKLAGGIAHDFNNLVTVINGHVGFVLDTLSPDHPARHDLEQVERAGIRAANLTQQILAFSRRQLLRPETVDASAVIRDVRRMLNRLIGEHIAFETVHVGDATVRVDRGQLEQLLVNLIVNARDAMPDGGRLVVSTACVRLPDGVVPEGWEPAAGEYVKISVRDTGTGMDAQTLARAFDPFFTTKPLGKGTGLGLATVFGIAKQSGGHVSIESAVGTGTTVHVWLPAIAEAVVQAMPPALAPGPERGPRLGTRVLVVEDEAALRDLTARVLRRSGYEVSVAADGVDGLAHVRANAIDVLVSDLVMPRWPRAGPAGARVAPRPAHRPHVRLR